VCVCVGAVRVCVRRERNLCELLRETLELRLLALLREFHLQLYHRDKVDGFPRLASLVKEEGEDLGVQSLLIAALI
jgi:hypothetical protein